MKGVMARINPSARFIDITHEIPSFDILSGSFVLYAVYSYFPPGTVFLVVVDPGVGTSRKILLAEAGECYFIAPDNGVLSLVLEKEKTTVRYITNSWYFLRKESRTFEGRDKMAPVAAWLSKGKAPEGFGPKLERFEKIPSFKKAALYGDEILGTVLYVDKFGNLITNISHRLVKEFQNKKNLREMQLICKAERIPFKSSYSSVLPGEGLCLVDSLELLEIAVRKGSAAERLKARPGDEVVLKEKK